MQKKLHIKVGDAVKVIAGQELGKEGKVLSVDRKKMRATVEGLQMIKKHSKQVLKIHKVASLKEKQEFMFRI